MASNCRERDQMVHGEIDGEGLKEGGPTSTPLAASGTQGTFTQHPTIDFDGLSWPSRWICWRGTTGLLTDPRSRNTPEEGGDQEGKGRTPGQAVRRCKDDPGMRG